MFNNLTSISYSIFYMLSLNIYPQILSIFVLLKKKEFYLNLCELYFSVKDIYMQFSINPQITFPAYLLMNIVPLFSTTTPFLFSSSFSPPSSLLSTSSLSKLYLKFLKSYAEMFTIPL